MRYSAALGEVPSEDDDDRPHHGSGVRAKSSTPVAASSRPTTSEVWRYFTKLADDSVQCNACKSEVSRVSSGRQLTSPLWDHLRSKHPKVFALTDFCRRRHIKVEVLSDDEQPSQPVAIDRPKTTTIASKPPSVADATPRPTVSEVWQYFTKLDVDVLLCNTCKKEVCRSALRRSSTSPAWEHLRVKHREVYETTEFFKQRQAKEEVTKKEADTDDSNLSVVHEVAPSSVRADTSLDQKMHHSIANIVREVAAFLACGTASVPSTAVDDVAGDPLERHATADSALPAPAPLRMQDPGFAIPDLDLVAPPETSDAPLVVFDSFAGIGAFRPLVPVPEAANEQQARGRTTFGEEQPGILEENNCNLLPGGRRSAAEGPRKPRTDFNVEQRGVLEEVFRRTKHIEREELQHLAQQLRVPEKSIRTWFQNRRARDKRTSANVNLSTATIDVDDEDGGNGNRSTLEAEPDVPAAIELDKQVTCFFDNVKENFMALSKEEKEVAKAKILQALDKQESDTLKKSDVSEESDASEDSDNSEVSDASSAPSASFNDGATLPSLSDWFGH